MAKTQTQDNNKHQIPRIGTNTDSDVSRGLTIYDAKSNSIRPAFPLAACLWPAKGTVSVKYGIFMILLATSLFKWATSLWTYSGFQSPPMYGDFEAQRHWMEITTHLPISDWYFHDLEWWGLDYPPLTAYYSWLLGYLGSMINPAWFYLHSSRGIEDPNLKIFMRASVAISELVVYIPAVVIAIRGYIRQRNVSPWEFLIVVTAFLMQPSTMLIDHGHFQYNTVMLGFSLASVACLFNDRFLWSCVCFVAALGFKQMALFYAPAIFAYLLGICLVPNVNIGKLFQIATVTVLSFITLFLPIITGSLTSNAHDASEILPPPPLFQNLPMRPSYGTFLYSPVLQLTQSVHRIFPFARGLFEDKVANFWCALNTFYKLRNLDSSMLSRLALIATTAAIVPAFVIILLRPRKDLLPWAVASVSWSFFLFSYQVHEKNVLLPLLPTTFLLASNGGFQVSNRAWIGLANILGSWTMFPLLEREQLRMPYTVLTLFWAYLLALPPTSAAIFSDRSPGSLSLASKIIQATLYVAMAGWHVLNGFVPTPEEKPDLWVVLNVLIGTSGFGLIYLWCLWNLFQKSNILETLLQGRRRRQLFAKPKRKRL